MSIERTRRVMATGYSPDQKRRFARTQLEASDEHPDTGCVDDDGHEFVTISTLTDSSDTLIGRFMCTKCRVDVTVELDLADVDEAPEEWDSEPIDDHMRTPTGSPTE